MQEITDKDGRPVVAFDVNGTMVYGHAFAERVVKNNQAEIAHVMVNVPAGALLKQEYPNTVTVIDPDPTNPPQIWSL